MPSPHPPDAGTLAAPPDGSASRSFRRWLALIAVVGLVLRLAYVWWYRDDLIAGDGFAYHLLAGHLADGRGFVNPMIVPAPMDSGRPPLWPLLLAASSWSGRRDWLDHQVLACLVGTGTIVLVGLATRAVARTRRSPESVGLVAAGLAAVYPGMWAYERSLLSETLLLAFVALFVLLVYRFIAAPGLTRSLLLGLCCGLLALTRSEQMLLGVVVIVPLILSVRGVPLVRRVGWIALAGLVTIGVMVPWGAYNTERFDELVPVTTGMGNAMVAANCDLTYEGDRLGYYDSRCTLRSPASYEPTVPARDRAQRAAALDYMGSRIERVPVVVLAREGRVLGLYRPGQMIDFFAEWSSTPSWVVTVWFAAYYGLALAAVGGWFVMRRRQLVIWPLLTFLGVVMLSAAVTFGETRYRAAAEVPLVIIAAFAFDALWRRWRSAEAGVSAPP